MALPPCFGVFWDGTADSSCLECEIKDDCLARFVRTTLLQLQQKLGDEATPERLANETGIKIEAVNLALNVQRNLGLIKSETPPPQVEVEPEIPEIQKEQKPESGEDMAAKKEEKASKKAPKKRGRPPKAKSEKAAKAKPKGKKAKSKTKPKTKPRAKSKKETIDRPTMARTSVSPATVLAKPTKQKSADTVLELAGERTWSPEHDRVRHERERKRNPVLAFLKPGQQLTREWPPRSGNKIVVKVLKYRYRWEEQEFPTLYSTAKAITGTVWCPKQKRPNGSRPEGKRKLAPWSGVKFFKASLIELGCFQALAQAQAKPLPKQKVRPKRPPPTKKKILYTTSQPDK